MLPYWPPPPVLADSYKATHPHQYPDVHHMVAYGACRHGFDHDSDDTRIVFYGIRYIVENYIQRQWTMHDLQQARVFYATHGTGNKPFQFPDKLFEQIVHENNGYLPITVEAIPEGTVINAHTPVYQISARAPYAKLVTFVETLMTHVWYPTTVATLSRRIKDKITDAFEKSVDPDAYALIQSRLHDFGFRGCTTVEQSIVGGCAHLLNFQGSDTMSAAYYAQFELNGGKPVAWSIPATEHSVMTAYRSEKEAIENMIERFGGEGKLFAVVMDSYDYVRALNGVLPTVAAKHVAKGGTMVLRPDSGDPVECVIQALEAGERVFGCTHNSKGFKILNAVSVIQGDGINMHTVCEILNATLEKGYSAQNVAFGMGGALLQKCNRDTLSFATKLNYMEYADGTKRDVMKYPKTDQSKASYPGMLSVHQSEEGLVQVLPRDVNAPIDPQNLLKVVYDCGPLTTSPWCDFDGIRQRVEDQWRKCPKSQNVVSPALQLKIDETIKQLKADAV